MPLRWHFGADDVLAFQVLNCFMSAGIVALTFVIGRSFFDQAVCRAATLTMALFPLHVFDALTYSSDIPGTLMFMGAIALALRNSRKWIWTGGLLGALLFLLRIQRGLDVVLVPLLFLLVLVLVIQGKRRTAARLAAAIGVALLILVPAAQVHSEWLHKHDVARFTSDGFGFLARGWNPVTLGEYYNRYEQLEWATPPERKDRECLALVITQIVRQPLFTLGVLPFAKIAKFHLVGYGSGLEQGLAAAGHETVAASYTGLRIFFAPLLLGLALVGVYRAYTDERDSGQLVFLVWVWLAACLGCAVFGESQPRYSHCVHFVFALMAAAGLRQCAPRIEPGFRPLRFALISVTVAGVAYVVFGVILRVSLERLAGEFIFEDMRRATSERCEARPVQYKLAHFERWLCSGEGSLALPRPGRWSMYVFCEDGPGVARVFVNGRLEAERQCSEIRLPTRLEVQVPTEGALRVRLDPMAPGTPTLRWGYVLREP